mmetsp:Transcript_67360/g.160737  ORF Transcript_67360/g.160737 Transcript_67360/m.160737 type:complete len:203 (-) Transcript_67360:170-778(-)
MSCRRSPAAACPASAAQEGVAGAQRVRRRPQRSGSAPRLGQAWQRAQPLRRQGRKPSAAYLHRSRGSWTPRRRTARTHPQRRRSQRRRRRQATRRLPTRKEAAAPSRLPRARRPRARTRTTGKGTWARAGGSARAASGRRPRPGERCRKRRRRRRMTRTRTRSTRTPTASARPCFSTPAPRTSGSGTRRFGSPSSRRLPSRL